MNPLSLNTKFIRSFAMLSAFCLLNSSVQAQKKWVGTWSAAPYSMAGNMPSTSLNNNSIRQVVRVSIGGDTLRMKFANTASSSPTTMNSVTIAVSTAGKDAIDTTTLKELKFSGNSKVTINANSTVISDPFTFDLKPGMKLAITIYYGQTASTMTGHVGSRTNSYILSGDKSKAKNFSGASTVVHWYSIFIIDVLTDKAAAVAILGNSITDGYGLANDLQNRWTDALSDSLLKDSKTQNVGVLNLGIGATNVASGDNSGLSRYKRDILEQSGLQWFVIFYGVNDINAGASANTIINAYKQMITDAKTKGISVYGATLTPFNGHSYYTPAHEQVRRDVNAWIRTTTEYNGYIDFDKIVRDPSDTTRFKAALKNDGLHPNAEGYKVMGQSVNHSLFISSSPKEKLPVHNIISDVKLSVNRYNNSTLLSFEVPNDDFVSLKLYSLLGQEITELAGRNFSSGSHTVEFNNKNLAKGIYFYSLKTGMASVTMIMVY